MNILVVGAVTGVLAAPAAANAIELNCPAPAVLVGDFNPGNDPVVSVHVYRFGDIGAWHVTYRFSSGVTISRGEQYDITTIPYGRTSYWTGPLKRDPNIVNLGAIYGPSAVGEYTYRETIRKNGQIIVEMEAGHCVRVDNQQAVTSPSPSISEEMDPKTKEDRRIAASNQQQANNIYVKCLHDNVVLFALLSTEPAETVVKAAIGACVKEKSAMVLANQQLGIVTDDAFFDELHKRLSNQMISDVLMTRVAATSERAKVHPSHKPAEVHM